MKQATSAKESKWQPSSVELVEKFHQAITSFPQAEKRKMFGYPCCFVNGNMVTGLHQQNWIIRLAENDREQLENQGGQIFEPMPGRVMREYRTLPQAVMNNEKMLLDWLKKSFDYAGSLPVKEKKVKKK